MTSNLKLLIELKINSYFPSSRSRQLPEIPGSNIADIAIKPEMYMEKKSYELESGLIREIEYPIIMPQNIVINSINSDGLRFEIIISDENSIRPKKKVKIRIL